MDSLVILLVIFFFFLHLRIDLICQYRGHSTDCRNHHYYVIGIFVTFCFSLFVLHDVTFPSFEGVRGFDGVNGF